MNESLQTQYGYAGTGLAADRQRVLRNTYWLLALSLVPTVLGAWVGVATGLFQLMSPGISMAVFFIGAFGLMFVIEKTKERVILKANDWYSKIKNKWHKKEEK